MTGIELKSITQVHAYRDITFCNSKGDRKARKENAEEILNTDTRSRNIVHLSKTHLKEQYPRTLGGWESKI